GWKDPTPDNAYPDGSCTTLPCTDGGRLLPPASQPPERLSSLDCALPRYTSPRRPVPRFRNRLLRCPHYKVNAYLMQDAAGTNGPRSRADRGEPGADISSRRKGGDANRGGGA